MGCKHSTAFGAVFFTGWVGFEGIKNANHRFTLVRNNNFRLAQVVSGADKSVIKWDREILSYVLTESPQKEI